MKCRTDSVARACLPLFAALLPLALAGDALGQSFAGPSYIDGPPTPLSVSSDLLVGDVDADGHLDVVAITGTIFQPFELTLYRGLGAGQFASKQVLGSAAEISTMCLADLDGDGALDIVTGDQNSLQVHWLKNDGSGAFGPKALIGVVTGILMNLWPVDVGGDGDIDVAVELALGADPFGWFENTGSATFGSMQTVLAGAGAIPRLTCLAEADLDGDSHIDLVGGTSTGGSSGGLVWIQQVGQNVYLPPQTITATATKVVDLVAGDFSEDGYCDIAASTVSELLVFRGLGGGNFETGVSIFTDATGIGATAMFASDVEADGDLDLLASFHPWSGSQILWAENLGGGHFGTPETIEGSSTDTVVAGGVADVDGDSDLDVIVAFHDPTIHGTAVATYECLLGAADCNGNGIPDVVDIEQGVEADCDVSGVPDSCEIATGALDDVDQDGVPDTCLPPPLMADTYHLSVSLGGVQSLIVTAPVPSGLYLLLGSTSGTSPGITSGGSVVPLNYDSYLLHTAIAPNTPPLSGSFGALTPSAGQGIASASFTLPANFDPALVGLTLHHAYVTVSLLSGQLTSVSNPVPLSLVP